MGESRMTEVNRCLSVFNSHKRLLLIRAADVLLLEYFKRCANGHDCLSLK